MSAEAIVSIIGPGSAEACLAARALVSVNGVAHRWLDTERDPVGLLLAQQAGIGADQPVAISLTGRGWSRRRSSSSRSPAATGRRGRAQAEAPAPAGMSGPARTPPELRDRYIASAQWRTEFAARAGLRTRPQTPDSRRDRRRQPGWPDSRILRRL